jgi:hypothetical protein
MATGVCAQAAADRPDRHKIADASATANVQIMRVRVRRWTREIRMAFRGTQADLG